MKVVINTCYGGFRISGKAMVELARRKGYDEVFPYYYDWHDDEFVKSNIMEADYFSIKDFGDVLSVEKRDIFFDALLPDISRTDPDLIAMIEEASDDCSSLKVVEIPDDVDWEIGEYDGVEWVEEKHRRWS